MKNLSSLLVVLLFAISGGLHAQKSLALNTSEKTGNTAAIEWAKKEYDFGKLKQNQPATAEFTLTNQSDQALLLTEVKPSCGCTIADYPQTPILPGESATIKATYNAKKIGSFQKLIKVYTNLNDDFFPLQLKGTVIEE